MTSAHEVDRILRKALENLRAERAAGRFHTVTLLATGDLVPEIAERLVRIGATEAELACFHLQARHDPMVEVVEVGERDA